MSAVSATLSGCRRWLRPTRPRSLSAKLLIVAVSIVLAFAVDAGTGGRWRWLSGGGAVLTSLLALVPRLSWLVKPVGAYIGVWLIFNLLRAQADDTGWADRVLDLVPRLEARLFAGRLPSAVLQERFYDPAALAWYDHGLTAVYLSFFVVPHLAALLLLWRNRRLFWHYLLATGALFAVALVGFFALPTSPPWLVTETFPQARFAEIRRGTEQVLSGFDLPVRLFNRGQGETAHVSEVRIEPNPVAAMPSIHFATTALLVYPARRAGRGLAIASIGYAGLMGVALVYLGEHYVLDLVVGGVLAAAGWVVADGCFDRWSSVRSRGAAAPPGYRSMRSSASANSCLPKQTSDGRMVECRRPRLVPRSAGSTPGSSGRGSRSPSWWPIRSDAFTPVHHSSRDGSPPLTGTFTRRCYHWAWANRDALPQAGTPAYGRDPWHRPFPSLPSRPGRPHTTGGRATTASRIGFDDA